jgi:hypothetical protein
MVTKLEQLYSRHSDFLMKQAAKVQGKKSAAAQRKAETSKVHRDTVNHWSQKNNVQPILKKMLKNIVKEQDIHELSITIPNHGPQGGEQPPSRPSSRTSSRNDAGQ